MKILIVNFSDLEGGAARAAYRLHNSLLQAGVDSSLLVNKKKSNDDTVIGVNSKIEQFYNRIRSFLDLLPIKLYSNRSKASFSVSWISSYNIVNKINSLKPDLVHLHWINAGMISISDLKKIDAPIVWSLHDMWAFTGGCHYDEECMLYESSCSTCKILQSNRNYDLSKYIYYKKEKVYSQLNNLTVIGLSNWLSESAKNSSLFKDKKIVNLPNPIDTEIFKQVDKITSRKLWNLPEDKKIILFGAMGALSDPRKGFKELEASLKNLTNENYECVVFGSSKKQDSKNIGLKIHYLGNINDDVSLVTLYNAVDIMIVPSLQENLSNAIMESLACATPVVGFDIGGNSDMIEHKKSGYLAKPFDVNDLADGIKYILNNPNYDEFCRNARKKVLNQFDYKVVSQKYIHLYRDILEDRFHVK